MRREQLVLKAIPALKVLRAYKVFKATSDQLVRKVQSVMQVQLERQVRKVLREMSAQPDLLEIPEPLAQPALKDLLDLQAQLARKVLKGYKEMLVLKVRPARQDRQVLKGQQDQLAHKDQQVLPEPLALAFQLEEQSDNCLQKHLRRIMILLGESPSPAEPRHQQADLTGTSTFNTSNLWPTT